LVANEGNITVALDITVTEELKQEGIARDIVNRVQNIRKSRDYDITDKINLVFAPNADTDAAINAYSDYIARQVLATSITIGDIAGLEGVETLEDVEVIPVEETTAVVTENVENEETVEAIEEEIVEETIEEVVEENVEEIKETMEESDAPVFAKANVGMVFGVECVFMPYYEGCESDDVLKIPMSKQSFEALKEKKQIKIFKNAEKKRKKEQIMQKKIAQRLQLKRAKELKKQKNDK
jgi:hypothetical protein